MEDILAFSFESVFGDLAFRVVLFSFTVFMAENQCNRTDFATVAKWPKHLTLIY